MKFGFSKEVYQQGMSDLLELSDSDLEAVYGGTHMGGGRHHHRGDGDDFGGFNFYGSPFSYGVPAFFAPPPAPAFYVQAPPPAPAFYVQAPPPAPAFYTAVVPYGAPAPCGIY